MLLKINPQLNPLNKQAASTTTMQLKKNPQVDAKNKPAVSTTTMQAKKKPQLDAKNKPAVSTTTMQVKKNPQLDARNKQAASTTTIQVNKKKSQLDARNKQAASTTMQVKKNPQLDALNKPAASTKTMQAKKKPQLDPLNKPAASTTTVQVKPNPKFDALNKRLPYSAKNIPPNKNRKSVAKTYQPHFPPIKEHKSGGGTLRIFVVLIIISILAAIALPELARCKPYKAMQSEAKQYVVSMNRAQQAKYADDGAFSNSITALGLGIKTETTNYNYSISATKNVAFSYGVSRSNNLRSYVGAVFLLPVSQAANDAKTTVSILCETNTFEKNTQPPNPIVQNDVPVCAAGSSEVTK